MEEEQGVNGAAAYKLAWVKLAQKIAVQVWREAKGLPVDLLESTVQGAEGALGQSFGRNPLGAFSTLQEP